jgi:oxygen-dependent protoporphyrinogen oxidase
MSGENKQDVVIVGAGVTGLTTAHFLRRHGVRVSIIEKGERHGGVIRSEQRDGFLFEHGPNSFLKLTPLLDRLVADLGINGRLAFANDSAKNRYIVRNGRLMALPLGPISAMRTPLFPLKAKLRVLKEPWIAPAKGESEESLADFVRRRLGQEMLDYAINPFVAGVYAGSPEELSVKAGFPKLYELERRYGSLIKGAIRGAKERKKQQPTDPSKRGMFSFKGGMQTLVDAMARESHGTLHTETVVRQIRRNASGFEMDLRSRDHDWALASRAVVLTVPAHSYDSLDFAFDLPIRDALKRIVHPPVSVVFFGFNKAPTTRALDGFGFLVPAKEERQILGTIWSSSIFSNRAPKGGAALTTFVGGTRWPGVADVGDEQLVDIVASDLRALMGVDATPDIVLMKRWPKAIPQYALGHLDIIRSIESLENDIPGLHIAGNFRGGISVTDCIEQSELLSRRVVERLGPGT